MVEDSQYHMLETMQMLSLGKIPPYLIPDNILNNFPWHTCVPRLDEGELVELCWRRNRCYVYAVRRRLCTHYQSIG